MATEWIQLVKKAKNSDKDFESLASEIEPILIVIARGLGGDPDELVQVARIAIWKALPKVKLDRPETIRGFLLVTSINAMKGFIRNEGRKAVTSRNDINELVFTFNMESHIQFKGLLQEYERYITQNGTFCGAHKCLAKKKGISVWSMRRRFHKAANLFLKNPDE